MFVTEFWLLSSAHSPIHQIYVSIVAIHIAIHVSLHSYGFHLVDLVFNPVANCNVAMPKFSHTLKGNTIPSVQNQHHGHDDYILVRPIQVEVMYNRVIEATQVNSISTQTTSWS